MAKKTTRTRQSVIGAVGGVLIGAAILLFVATMVLNSLKTSAGTATAHGADNDTAAIAARAEWNSTNTTIDSIKTFLTVCCILLGVLGIVIIGSSIIGSISGGFGG